MTSHYTYAIDNGNGDQITSGLPESTARKVAQELANERGETMYLYLCDGRERDRYEQCDGDGNDDAEAFEPEFGASDLAALVAAAREEGELAASDDEDGGSSPESMRRGPFGDDGWVFANVLPAIAERASYAGAIDDGVEARLRASFAEGYAAYVESIAPTE